MNKTLIYLFCAALVGLIPAQAKQANEAVEATSVHVSVNQGKASSTLVASPLYLPVDVQKNIFRDMKNGTPLKQDDKAAWHVVNIPIVITGRGKSKDGDKEPGNYVSELTVTAYLLYRAPKDKTIESTSKADGEAKKFCLVEKTITYVNIPLDTKSGKRESNQPVGYNEMSVALFFPRAEAYKITGSEQAADEMVKPDRFVGYAIEATYKGTHCPEAKVDKSSPGQGATLTSKLFDSKLKREIGSATWWKGRTREHFRPTEVQPLCISETPFAPFYGSYYPATKPLYGAPELPGSKAGETDPTLAPSADLTSETSTSSSSSSSSSSSRSRSKSKSTAADEMESANDDI